MNKKIIMPIAILLLIGIAGFVYASQVESYVTFDKGWNLITGFINPSQLSGGDILPENIKAVYILKQPTQEYVRVYPNPENDKLAGIDDDYYEKTPQWVYSDISGRTEYMFEEPMPIQYWNEHQLYNGWNMISITPEFAGYSLNQLKGTCNILKVYAFEDGQWANLQNNMDDDRMLGENSAQMKGIIIKVSRNCVMGLIGGEVSPPPTLPNNDCTDSDGGKNYFERGILRIPGNTNQDSCLDDGERLFEYFCPEEDEQGSEIYTCPNGCDDGACIQ